MTERCEICDRADCRWGLAGVADEPPPGAEKDCHAHRVDWRARALAAEQRAQRAEALLSRAEVIVETARDWLAAEVAGYRDYGNREQFAQVLHTYDALAAGGKEGGDGR